MPETLMERAPQVRCYECGRTDIFSVCHHCGRPMCEEHSPRAFREGGVLVKAPRGSADEAKPASAELAGLGLRGRNGAVYHCTDDAHMVRGSLRSLIVAGAVIAVLGIILLFLATLPGLVVFIIGAAIGGGVFGITQLRGSAASKSRRPVPVVPHVNKVDIVEHLSGTVRLEKGEYKSTVKGVSGRIKIDMSTNEGGKLLQSYRKKYKLPETQPVGFTAGTALLQGEAGLAFLANQPVVLPTGLGLSLSADSVDGHPLLPADAGQGLGEWVLTADYQLKDRAPDGIPLWIVPSLVPSSDRRALEVDLHWNPLGPEEQQLDLEVFDRIELRLPADWGDVEDVAPGRQAEVGHQGERRIITWRQLKPEDDNSRSKVEGSKSVTLRMMFARPITERSGASGNGEHDRLTLCGTLEASFGGVLSGLTGVGLYLPGGGQAHRPQIKPRTKVEVTFDISLGALRYQDDRVVPDENNAEDLERGRNKVKEKPFERVVPDYKTVADLTNMISGSDFYVKSVVEHAPYRDDAHPNVVNRVWDIAGRWYEGIFPVDFGINLRGQEIAQPGSAEVLGRTFAQVTVKGAYARSTIAADDGQDGDGQSPGETPSELLERIEDTWMRLQAQVGEVLERNSLSASGRREIAAPAIDDADFVLSEMVESDEESGFETNVVDVDVIESDEPEPAPAPPGDSNRKQRVAALRERRQAADEAVILGRIKEETHSGIIARIDAELRELGESS